MINLTAAFTFQAFFNSLPGVFGEGFAWAVLAIGVYISYKVLDLADMSVDGTLALGGVLTTVLIAKDLPLYLVILLAVLSGAAAGAVTGLLHTKLKIPAILSGILTMFALYSINIHIMNGSSALGILGKTTLNSFVADKLGIDKVYADLIIAGVAAALVIGLVYWFFGTRLGSALRATGCNPDMARAQGIDTDLMKITGLMISNALAAFAGSLISQSNNVATVDMGSGTIVIGLASVVIGELIFGEKLPFGLKLIGAAVGSVIYRLVINTALLLDMPSFDMKLAAAVIVALALSLPRLKKAVTDKKPKRAKKEKA